MENIMNITKGLKIKHCVDLQVEYLSANELVRINWENVESLLKDSMDEIISDNEINCQWSVPDDVYCLFQLESPVLEDLEEASNLLEKAVWNLGLPIELVVVQPN